MGQTTETQPTPFVDEWQIQPEDIYFTNEKDVLPAPISN